ncbi:MAG: hypothetical protein QHI48_08600 [Bacteroidota bacterium]|nr:hypothetical protein [Bacteroidota bacterium]
MRLGPDIKTPRRWRFAGQRPSAAWLKSRPLIFIMVVLFLSISATAQESVLRDRAFPFLEGSWDGVVESRDGLTSCTMRCVPVLQDGFLRCETCFRRTMKEPCSSGEEHMYLRSSGEHAIVLYIFSNHGVVFWGTLAVSGKKWAGELRGSDGSTRTLVFLWEDADSVVLTVEETGGGIYPAGVGSRKLHRQVRSPR